MSVASFPRPILIDPAAVYTVATAVLALDIPSASIRRAIRIGELPAVRRSRRLYIAGRDLLAWVTPTEAKGDKANG